MKRKQIIVLIVILAALHQLFPASVLQLTESARQKLDSNDKTCHIISSINDGNYTIDSKTASIDDVVKLSIVCSQKSDNKIIIYSNFNNLEIEYSGVNVCETKPLIELGKVSIKWYKIEERDGNDYSNTAPTWHWENIPYKETEVIGWRDQFIVVADVTPTVFDPVFCNGKIVGTIRYKAVLNIDGDSYSTPGKDSRYKGSISNKVHRISLKGNTECEVINFALALCNLPYIWGSASFTGSVWDKQQAELFIGADCADFAVAAHQLAGKQLPYDCIKDQFHTKIIAKQHSQQNGNYLTSQEEFISIGDNGVQTGDFIYWGRAHVGLFYADKSDPESSYAGEADGKFNQWDLVIHTLFAEPKIECISDIPNYGDLTVYRFTKKE